MNRLPGDRRIWTLLAFPGLMLLLFWLERGVLARQVAERTPAEEVAYWEAHVERNPDYVASQVRLGVAYQQVGRSDAAEAAYRRALELDGDWDAAALALYGVERAKGERDAARTRLEAYSRTHPRCAVCWHNVALEHLDLGRLDDAALAVESLLASGLTMTTGLYDAQDLRYEAFVLSGRVHSTRGEFDRGIADFREALQRDVPDARAHIGLARSLLGISKPDDAMVVLDEAELLFPRGDGRTGSQLEATRRRALQQAGIRGRP